MQKLILIGSGGHAKVIADTLSIQGRKITACVTLDTNLDTFCGVPVIGGDSELEKYSPKDAVLVNGIGSIPGKIARWEISKKYRALGYQFLTVLHPSAFISACAHISNGAQIMAGALIQAGVTIGEDTIVNTGAILDHDCDVGANCHIAPGVTCSGEVSIGESCHVGTGATIIQRVLIGPRSVVTAGAIVKKDLPAGSFQRSMTLPSFK